VRIALSHVRVFVRAIGLRSRSRSICRSFSRARCSSLQLVQWDSASPTSPSDRDGAGLERSGARTSDPPACRTRLVLRHGAPAGANCALSSRFVTRTFATRRGGRPPFLSAIFPLESQKSLSRRPSGRRARILRRPRHFLVDQQCSEMRLRSSGLSASANRRLPTNSPSESERPEFCRVAASRGSPPGWQAVAGRQTCASPATPRLRGRHGPRRPGPSTNLSPHAARYAGVPTGSPCVLVLGLCGLCRSNCRTIGLLRARRCDA
jgi:hypothetical protein